MEVYEPKVLSIGPYHQGSPAVEDMQRAKYHYLDYVLKLNPEKKLADYLSAIKGLEKQVRCAYANEIKMDRDAFLRTLLLDGCFILVALHGIEGIISPTPCRNLLDRNTREVNANTKEFGTRHKITQNSPDNLWEEENSNQEYFYYETVSRDLLLLENQIPFSIVEKIYQVLVGQIDASLLLSKFFSESITDIICCPVKKLIDDHQPIEFYHLLHLCHMLFKLNYLCAPNRKDLGNPNNQLKPQSRYRNIQLGDELLGNSKQVIIPIDVEFEGITIRAETCSWRQATAYHAVQIVFKKKEICNSYPRYSLFDIGFCGDTMEIPSLTIDQRTYCLLRNLVAFEQACPQFGNYISAYVLFWSQLVSMADDAALLTKKGVLINQLQSDTEVVHLFNSLSEDVIFDPNSDNYLKPICLMLEAHFQRRRPRWRELFGKISSRISHLFRQSS